MRRQGTDPANLLLSKISKNPFARVCYHYADMNNKVFTVYMFIYGVYYHKIKQHLSRSELQK